MTLTTTPNEERGTQMRAPARRRSTLRIWKKRLMPWLFISPFIILFMVFTLFPLLFSIYLSFQEWNPVAGLSSMEYVGLYNYQLALTDPWLWKSLYNTVWLAVVSGIPQHLLAIPVAYMLVSAVRGRLRHLYTATMFIPFITSTVAVALIFFSIYSTNAGILNQWLLALSNLPVLSWFFSWVQDAMPIRWLTSSDLLKPSIAMVVIWKYTGFNIVVYSAGFLTVSRDLYDAAKVDGCSRWQQFWHVALPMIRPFIFFAVTLTIIGNLQLFEEPYVLTQGESGGVAQSGLTASYYLYLVGWQWLEMGAAAAISWILFLFIAIATGVHFYFNGRKGLGEDR
ncbi:sugar ABC transporter permease [Pseudovibrio exalbescens]|uniref:carbohydrate ABC transporter permease n=1 Tax=Pseudovibrio exalbescens TaxID=197461 RepID=UPI002365EFB6|nr:sugar ABC transporter permease [Pseudovibrio exalbescens]MDD7909279.1 sugar ABC transporter permease [Pseudovibrio exalbescens]